MSKITAEKMDGMIYISGEGLLTANEATELMWELAEALGEVGIDDGWVNGKSAIVECITTTRERKTVYVATLEPPSKTKRKIKKMKDDLDKHTDKRTKANPNYPKLVEDAKKKR